MSGRELGILRQRAAECMKDVSFLISTTLPWGKPLFQQLFLFLCWCCFDVALVCAFTHSHWYICRRYASLYNSFFFFLLLFFHTKQSSVCKPSCLLQGAHGALHYSNRPGVGGGNAKESDGKSQQEGPSATFLSVTGFDVCEGVGVSSSMHLFHDILPFLLPDQTDVSH